MPVKYFSYGSNMSASYLKKIRNVKTSLSQVAKLKDYQFVMNMPGPNFIEPGFGNITEKKGFYVEGMLHEISDDDFRRIVASEGEDYMVADISLETDSGLQLSKTLIYKSDVKELKTSRRYLKLIVNAARENKLSIEYINELSQIRSVYYPVLSEYYSIVVYFWVKSRARKIG
ncbi:MAG: gamma-glutamylcyclotransferase [Paracoccaceae bacterium]|jgi:hypothetical protein|nr:gamma-glutamylcyclotransferase [Paracoccaceae bacterium]